MYDIVVIKKAFKEWLDTTGQTLKKVCKELTVKHSTFAYQTVAAILQLNKNNEQVHHIKVIEKIEKIVEHTGFNLVLSDPKNRFSCLKENATLNVQLREGEALVKISDKRYYLYYLKWNETVAKEILILDFETEQASIKHYTGIEEKSYQGSIKKVNNSVYLIHIMNNDQKPYWYITYNHSNQNKDFRLCLYLKISGKNSEPTVGEAIVVRENIVNSLEQEREFNTEKRKIRMDDFAQYVLFKKRKQLPVSKLFTKEIFEDKVAPEESDLFPQVVNWHNIRRFIGTWDGFFINPIGKCFEICHIRIDPNGNVKIWVPVDTSTPPYIGICKKINDLLIIKYDYLTHLEDYRSSIIIEVGGYKNKLYNKEDNYTTLYGILAGVERNKSKPVATRIALRKVNFEPLDFDETTVDSRLIRLEIPQDIQKLNEELNRIVLFDFFHGKLRSEYTSIDLLNSIGGQ